MRFGRESEQMKHPFVILILTSLFVVAPLLADHVYLKNGKVLHGEIVKEDDDSVTVRMPQGSVKLRRDQIDRIERESLQAYQLGMAREQIARGRYLVVIDELEHVLRRSPGRPELVALLAKAYAEFGQRLQNARRMEEAARCFRRLNELQPDSDLAAAGLRALAGENARLSELLRRARQTAAEGDYGAAIQQYEEALQFSPDAGDTASGELALCLARHAEGLIRREQYGMAAAQLERSFALDPALAGKLENLYAAASLNDILRRLQPGKAADVQQDVERALNFAPSHPAVLYVAGRLEEVRQDFKAAGGYYARALSVAPSRPTAERVAAWRTQLEESLGVTGEALRLRLDPVDETVYSEAKPGSFEVLSHPGFLIYHYNAQLAQEIGRNLDAQLYRICTATGLQVDWTKSPVRVYIHRTQEEYAAATGQAAWTGGMSRFVSAAGQGARNLELHSWQTSPRLLKSVLPHELMHLVLASCMKRHDDLPRALHEGFAVLMEPDFRHVYYLEFLKRRAAGQAYLPLTDLLRMKDYPRDPEFFYAEGFALVAYLASSVGVRPTLALIHNRDNEDIETRLCRLAGSTDLDQLEQGWLKWMATSRSNLRLLR